VPSNDLEEADGEEQSSPSLLNDELRQEMRARQAKMHRYWPLQHSAMSCISAASSPSTLMGATVMKGACELNGCLLVVSEPYGDLSSCCTVSEASWLQAEFQLSYAFFARPCIMREHDV